MELRIGEVYDALHQNKIIYHSQRPKCQCPIIRISKRPEIKAHLKAPALPRMGRNLTETFYLFSQIGQINFDSVLKIKEMHNGMANG